MSRALQIKQTGDILGTKLSISDDDIIQSLTEIVTGLHVKGEEPLIVTTIFIVSFSQRLKREDGTDEYFVYMHYDKIKNSLMYTTYLTERIRKEDFKMTRQKFHRLLTQVMNKRLNVRIGKVFPHYKHAKFPVC